MNCLAFCFLSALTAMNNSSCFLRPSIDQPLPPSFVCCPQRRESVHNDSCNLAKHRSAFFLACISNKAKVALTSIASSWSSVHIPFFCVKCTTVLRNNLIGFAPVKKIHTFPFSCIILDIHRAPPLIRTNSKNTSLLTDNT